MPRFEPNVATADFPENQKRGIMICGYNWGFSKRDQAEGIVQDTHKSFFSDNSVNNYPYRNRIVHWFELWGHPLSEQGEGAAFERSIVQTNWCRDQSNNNGNTEYQKCLNEKQNFFDHIDFYEPAIIMFMGIRMFEIFTGDLALKSEVKERAGAGMGQPSYMTQAIERNGRKLRQFRIGLAEYERCTVIGLPHPTSSRGLAGDYIAAFRYILGPVFQNYKNNVLPSNRAS